MKAQWLSTIAYKVFKSFKRLKYKLADINILSLPNLTNWENEFMFILEHNKVLKQKLNVTWGTHMELTAQKHYVNIKSDISIHSIQTEKLLILPIFTWCAIFTVVKNLLQNLLGVVWNVSYISDLNSNCSNLNCTAMFYFTVTRSWESLFSIKYWLSSNL